MSNSNYYFFFKYALDFSFAFFLLIILSPLMILIAVLIKLKLGSPIFFIQERPGLNQKLFKLIKFRSMNVTSHLNDGALGDKARLTKFGCFLRSSSIDEIPSLVNVLMGHMSLVGPRPLLPEYLQLYSKAQAKRHKVRPGITGWAQVNGRNSISWNDKFDLDLWYVNNQSLFIDFKILFITIKQVLKREGINNNADLTMEKFKGNKVEKS